jgi:hypothetical protein
VRKCPRKKAATPTLSIISYVDTHLAEAAAAQHSQQVEVLQADGALLLSALLLLLPQNVLQVAYISES